MGRWLSINIEVVPFTQHLNYSRVLEGKVTDHSSIEDDFYSDDIGGVVSLCADSGGRGHFRHSVAEGSYSQHGDG